MDTSVESGVAETDKQNYEIGSTLGVEAAVEPLNFSSIAIETDITFGLVEKSFDDDKAEKGE